MSAVHSGESRKFLEHMKLFHSKRIYQKLDSKTANSDVWSEGETFDRDESVGQPCYHTKRNWQSFRIAEKFILISPAYPFTKPFFFEIFQAVSMSSRLKCSGMIPSVA